MNNVAALIDTFKETYHLSDRQLADVLGFGPTYISKLRKGGRNPGKRFLEALNGFEKRNAALKMNPVGSVKSSECILQWPDEALKISVEWWANRCGITVSQLAVRCLQYYGNEVSAKIALELAQAQANGKLLNLNDHDDGLSEEERNAERLANEFPGDVSDERLSDESKKLKTRRRSSR